MKITTTQLIEDGDAESVPTYSLHPYVLPSLVQEHSMLSNEKCAHQPGMNSLSLHPYIPVSLLQEHTLYSMFSKEKGKQ